MWAVSHRRLRTSTIGAAGITNAGVTPTPSSREASTKNIENTLNWVKGAHSLSFGGALTQVDLWLKNQTLVPSMNFGIVTGDPAEAMFTPANFPGASNTQITAARNLYAVLTGRLSSIAGNARLNEDTNEYEYLGLGTQRGRMREFGLFVAGQLAGALEPDGQRRAALRAAAAFLRAQQLYATATVEDVWGVSGVGNLFMPGVMTGKKPTFTGYGKGEPAYDTDYNNFAPTLGLAWAPGPRGGLIGRLLGRQDGDSVFRAGYSLAYNRPGMSDFSDVFGVNPGITLDATRNVALSNLNADGRGYPVLLRDASRLGPPSNIPLTQQYPFTEVITGDLNIFDPAAPGAVFADVDRELGTQDLEQHRHRRALRRHAPPAGMGRLQLQRSEHHRERLPRRVPEGAGQPAGEHRGRPRQHVRVHRRRRHVTAADLPGLPERPRRQPARAIRRSTPAARGPAPTSPTPWRFATRRRSRRRGPTRTPASTATRRGAPMRWRRASPRISSAPIRISRAACS